MTTEEQRRALVADYWREFDDGRFRRSPYGGRQELAPPADEGREWTLTDIYYYGPGEPPASYSSLEEAMSAANKIVDERIRNSATDESSSSCEGRDIPAATTPFS